MPWCPWDGCGGGPGGGLVGFLWGTPKVSGGSYSWWRRLGLVLAWSLPVLSGVGHDAVVGAAAAGAAGAGAVRRRHRLQLRRREPRPLQPVLGDRRRPRGQHGADLGTAPNRPPS